MSDEGRINGLSRGTVGYFGELTVGSLELGIAGENLAKRFTKLKWESCRCSGLSERCFENLKSSEAIG